MASIYNDTDLYDIPFTSEYEQALEVHYRTVMEENSMKPSTLLDCSIGTGKLTLPLAKLGWQVAGSDLSPVMLEKCRVNFDEAGQAIPGGLHRSDFRKLVDSFNKPFDLVMSTGNALPHVTNSEVEAALSQMDALVKPGGFLYLDTRNWDQILATRQRFNFYPPYYRDGTRINLTQVWDFNPDGSVSFNLLYTFEKDGHIYDKAVFEELYYPIARDFIVTVLKGLGYANPVTMPFVYHGRNNVPPGQWHWYCILARKNCK